MSADPPDHDPNLRLAELLRAGHGKAADEVSLRDHFATAALQGYLAGLYASHDEASLQRMVDRTNRRSIAECVAIGSYRFADAMLKEREK